MFFVLCPTIADEWYFIYTCILYRLPKKHTKKSLILRDCLLFKQVSVGHHVQL